MRSPWLRLLILVIAPTIGGSKAARADWWPYTETVYTTSGGSAFVTPTSYVPTTSSFLVPSSYSYVVPTVYSSVVASVPVETVWTPTSYGTTYVPSAYYVRERVARRPLFSRRRDYIVPTTIYYPTSTVVPTRYRYYAPTVFEYPVISEVAYRTVPTTVSSCCGDSVVVAAAPPVAERRVVRDEAVINRRAETASSRDSVVESDTANDADDDRASVSSKVQDLPAATDAPAELSEIPRKTQPKVVQPDVKRPVADTAAQPATATSPPIAPAAPSTKPAPIQEEIRKSTPAPATTTPPAQTKPSTPPTTTAPTKGPDTSKSQAGAPESKSTVPGASAAKPQTGPEAKDPLPPPTAPSDLPPVEPVPSPAADLPAATELPELPPKSREALKPVLQVPRLTFLKGRVLSEISETPEEGVRVTISSRTKAFEDRYGYSNQAGRFAIKVPDGDWTVKVTMPSGRLYSVYNVTVSNGVITDDEGREVPGLRITR